MKRWTDKNVYAQVSAPAHRDSRRRDGGDKLIQVRGEGNASVGHAIATVLWLVCLFYGVFLEMRRKG